MTYPIYPAIVANTITNNSCVVEAKRKVYSGIITLYAKYESEISKAFSAFSFLLNTINKTADAIPINTKAIKKYISTSNIL